jgi:hypothetical protein
MLWRAGSVVVASAKVSIRCSGLPYPLPAGLLDPYMGLQLGNGDRHDT